jgi:YD repeat-containing protein
VIAPGTNGGTTTFRYDPFGRRIQKSGPLGTTNYVYDGLNGHANVIDEVDSAGNVLARYVHGKATDEPLAEGASQYRRYFRISRLSRLGCFRNV